MSMPCEIHISQPVFGWRAGQLGRPRVRSRARAVITFRVRILPVSAADVVQVWSFPREFRLRRLGQAYVQHVFLKTDDLQTQRPPPSVNHSEQFVGSDREVTNALAARVINRIPDRSADPG